MDRMAFAQVAASVVSHLLHNHNGRFGRFAVLMQILNLIFWLPVALNISASALQFIVNADGGAGACNVLYPALLATFAVLLAWPIFGAGFEPTVRWLTLAGCGVLALRALGDGRVVGFSKRERGTLFARRDDAYYTPLVVLLAAGAYAATWLA